VARVILFGAVWIALLAAIAAVVRVGSLPEVPLPSRNVPVVTPAPPPSPPPPPPRAGARYPGWTVTRAYAAHYMMVVEVETDRTIDASGIAAQVVEPLKGRYDEVLIYIREPGQRPDDLPARRIQWTPRSGYVETVYKR